MTGAKIGVATGAFCEAGAATWGNKTGEVASISFGHAIINARPEGAREVPGRFEAAMLLAGRVPAVSNGAEGVRVVAGGACVEAELCARAGTPAAKSNAPSGKAPARDAALRADKTGAPRRERKRGKEKVIKTACARRENCESELTDTKKLEWLQFEPRIARRSSGKIIPENTKLGTSPNAQGVLGNRKIQLLNAWSGALNSSVSEFTRT